MEEVLSNLRAEHAEEFHVIRLNGFIHTDDKLALKEIWRQLGKEMEIEEDLVNKVRYIIAILSQLLLTGTNANRPTTMPTPWPLF